MAEARPHMIAAAQMSAMAGIGTDGGFGIGLAGMNPAMMHALCTSRGIKHWPSASSAE